MPTKRKRIVASNPYADGVTKRQPKRLSPRAKVRVLGRKAMMEKKAKTKVEKSDVYSAGKPKRRKRKPMRDRGKARRAVIQKTAKQIKAGAKKVGKGLKKAVTIIPERIENVMKEKEKRHEKMRQNGGRYGSW